jgi:hypothetical protein
LPDTTRLSEIVAALVIRDERLALTLGPARAWEDSPGSALAPLALPSMFAPPGAGREEALALGARVLGLELEPIACRWTYGPSARHAMDREPATASDAPFLRYERLDAPDDASGEQEARGEGQHLPRRVTVRVYLARARGAGATGEMAVIWLPLSALQEARRGLWLAALLAMDGVELIPAMGALSVSSTSKADSMLVFMPAGAGERQILRACAKYGDAILFPPRMAGGA